MKISKQKTIFIIFLFIFFSFCLSNSVKGSTIKEGIENFPDSYKPYLYELQKKYPKWSFSALYTELDWNYVINNQNVFGKNLVPKSYSDEWKNKKQGEYNVEVDAGWVDASRKSLEYVIDSRNFLNEVRLFQFEKLSYDVKSNNKDGIEKILYGTEFNNKIVEYKDYTGTNIVTDKKYSDLILNAAVSSNVSSYHLASRIKQEVGPFLSHNSISGTIDGYLGLFNFYNIGATSDPDYMQVIRNGLQYAKDGKGASVELKNRYIIPWNTKEKSITGGAKFIGSSYINVGQNTIYLQKFDVNDEKQGELFWHQYMTNILAPYSESKLIYNGYLNSNLLSTDMSFVIPIYNNMPNIPTDSPNILDTDYIDDNTRMYPNVSNTLNVRTGPGTSYETLTQISKYDVVLRIKKGKQSGELWDKVILDDGMIGFVFQSYMVEVPKVEISNINLSVDKNTINKNETIKINVEILPEEALGNKIIFESSNEKIALVDESGNVLGVSSGNVDIIVSSEDRKVSKSLSMNIYTPVEEMYIDNTNINLREGNTFKINSIISPEDASNTNVIWSSLDTDIAVIDQFGVITALKEGKTDIKVVTEDGNKEKIIKLNVIAKTEDMQIIFDESLNINGNEISGLDLSNITVNKMKDDINTDNIIEIYDFNNKFLKDENLIGTGSKILIKNINNEVIEEYNILIYGDVNGDGRINSVDLLILQRHILRITPFNGIFLKAGNISKDGKNPSAVDSLKIQRHILKLQSILQR